MSIWVHGCHKNIDTFVDIFTVEFKLSDHFYIIPISYVVLGTCLYIYTKMIHLPYDLYYKALLQYFSSLK